MERGLLLVDQNMNTVIIPVDDIADVFRKNKGIEKRIRRNGSLKNLDKAIREYIRGEYD